MCCGFEKVKANIEALVLTNLGEKMSDDEVDELLKAVDTSSGEINYTGTFLLTLPYASHDIQLPSHSTPPDDHILKSLTSISLCPARTRADHPCELTLNIFPHLFLRSSTISPYFPSNPPPNLILAST